MKASILPKNVKFFINEMKHNIIPSNLLDIKINGDDILRISGLEPGPKIGIILEKMIRDALMNRFKWKNRNETLKYLQSIL